MGGKVNIPRYEMLNPHVIKTGTDLVLAYNVVNYGPDADGSENPNTRCNSTQVYRRIGNHWRVVHVHVPNRNVPNLEAMICVHRSPASTSNFKMFV